MDFIINLDILLFKSIHSLSGEITILDWISIFLSEDSRIFMGGLFILGLFLIYKRNPKRPVYSIFLATIIFLLPVFTSAILREAIMRPRPFLVFEITPLIEQSIRPSLPSNHTAASFAISGMYLAFLKNHFKPVFILACLIGIARIHAGIHFPLDVLTGGIIGIMPGLGLYYHQRNYPVPKEESLLDKEDPSK